MGGFFSGKLRVESGKLMGSFASKHFIRTCLRQNLVIRCAHNNCRPQVPKLSTYHFQLSTKKGLAKANPFSLYSCFSIIIHLFDFFEMTVIIFLFYKLFCVKINLCSTVEICMFIHFLFGEITRIFSV